MKAKEILMYVFSSLIIVGEILLIGFMIYIWKAGASTIDPNVINLVYSLAIGYHSGFMLVLGYHFGSSRGSADKNELLRVKDDTGTA
jgi:uncharacterized membrane-anchored protein